MPLSSAERSFLAYSTQNRFCMPFGFDAFYTSTLLIVTASGALLIYITGRGRPAHVPDPRRARRASMINRMNATSDDIAESGDLMVDRMLEKHMRNAKGELGVRCAFVGPQGGRPCNQFAVSDDPDILCKGHRDQVNSWAFDPKLRPFLAIRGYEVFVRPIIHVNLPPVL